jgi:hypothetical protein
MSRPVDPGSRRRHFQSPGHGKPPRKHDFVKLYGRRPVSQWELQHRLLDGSIGYGGGGGGIYNLAGDLNVKMSTFATNLSGFGGGIYNSTGATLTVVNSTFAGNTAGATGGAILNDGSSTATLSNVTVWNNLAQDIPDISPLSINVSSSGSTNCDPNTDPNCNVIYRLAPNVGGGGGVFNSGDGGTLTLKNSLLASSLLRKMAWKTIEHLHHCYAVASKRKPAANT